MASRLCVVLDPRQRGPALDGAARVANGNLLAQYARKCVMVVSDTDSQVLLVRSSRVGNRFPVLAEFLWVLLPTFLEGFLCQGFFERGRVGRTARCDGFCERGPV